MVLDLAPHWGPYSGLLVGSRLPKAPKFLHIAPLTHLGIENNGDALSTALCRHIEHTELRCLAPAQRAEL